jgi:hypothetical protein
MAPIPIYTQSPITAAKPTGVTPQTAAPLANEEVGRSVPATRTSVASQDAYPPAQPGAVPSLPAPTGSVQNQRYVPVQPTPTVKEAESGPPPPQPGAVPTLPGGKPSVPPPPRAGESYHPPEVTQAPKVPYPPQMSIPAPTLPHAQRGTSTATAGRHPQAAQPTSIGAGSGGELNHPPGYHQNVNAGDFDSHQRAAHFANVSSERRGSSGGDDDDEGVWDTARKLVQAAGSKLSAAESEVWRRINKE